MRKIWFIVSILFHLYTVAQNLVNNSSFEILSTCPTFSSRQATLCVNWQNPTQDGTPDVYNTCLPGLVPSNGITYYQWPRTGNSYVGIWCYEKTMANVREYMHAQLSNTLTSNNFYYVRFYTVLSNVSKYASNNLGLYFSNNSIYQSGTNNYLLNYTPQIRKFNNPIITDTLNWIEISGIYEANGNENYITIGNFNNDATTDTSFSAPNNVYGTSYYFLDDVSVENITTPQWQYRDTTIYLGDSVLIGPAISGLNVDWFDISSTFIKNAPGIYVNPTVTTPYQATETFNSVVYNHTVTVTVLMPVKVDEYEQLQNSIKIFPNPTNGNFNLQFDDFKSGEIEITISDVTGKQVFKNTLNVVNALTLFNLDVKNGIYFVKITNKDKTIIKKLVVQQ